MTEPRPEWRLVDRLDWMALTAAPVQPAVPCQGGQEPNSISRLCLSYNAHLWHWVTGLIDGRMRNRDSVSKSSRAWETELQLVLAGKLAWDGKSGFLRVRWAKLHENSQPPTPICCVRKEGLPSNQQGFRRHIYTKKKVAFFVPYQGNFSKIKNIFLK